MATISLFKKRGDYLSLRSLPGKGTENTFVNLPRFSLSTPPGTIMNINPPYKDVPFYPEKLASLAGLIHSLRGSYDILKVADPKSEGFFSTREWLKINEDLYREVTGGQTCP